jgi:hypothetical protein
MFEDMLKSEQVMKDYKEKLAQRPGNFGTLVENMEF